jgi:hypothetical protein
MTATAPILTDSHEITAEMLCSQGGVCSDTLRNHITAGLIEPGQRRPGVGRRLFWTRTQANKWLRRIGKRDQQFA